MTCITRTFIVASVLLAVLTSFLPMEGNAAGMPFQQAPQQGAPDTLKYPIRDRRGDRFTSPGRSSFDLKNPPNITDSIEYDPKTRQYYIVEKVGNRYYRSPTYLTFEEFQRIQARKAEIEYFKKRSNILSSLNRKMERPKLQWHNSLVNRIFGAGPDGLPKVEIRPQGNIDILAGYQGQKIKNPAPKARILVRAIPLMMPPIACSRMPKWKLRPP